MTEEGTESPFFNAWPFSHVYGADTHMLLPLSLLLGLLYWTNPVARPHVFI